MVYNYIAITLVLVGLLIPTTIFSARASVDETVEEDMVGRMCDANPDDPFCTDERDAQSDGDGVIGGNDDEDNVGEKRECENPPNAASCNNEDGDNESIISTVGNGYDDGKAKGKEDYRNGNGHNDNCPPDVGVQYCTGYVIGYNVGYASVKIAG